MKRICLLLLLAAFCSSGWTQAQKPAAKKPAAAPAKEASAPAAAKEAPAAEKVASGKKSRRSEDARACLEKASNTEIIKCAEAYL